MSCHCIQVVAHYNIISDILFTWNYIKEIGSYLLQTLNVISQRLGIVVKSFCHAMEHKYKLIPLKSEVISILDSWLSSTSSLE